MIPLADIKQTTRSAAWGVWGKRISYCFSICSTTFKLKPSVTASQISSGRVATNVSENAKWSAFPNSYLVSIKGAKIYWSLPSFPFLLLRSSLRISRFTIWMIFEAKIHWFLRKEKPCIMNGLRYCKILPYCGVLNGYMLEKCSWNGTTTAVRTDSPEFCLPSTTIVYTSWVAV